MPIQLLPNQGPCLATSRRAFLQSLTVGATAILAGRAGRAAERQDGRWYAWLSDTHIAADPKAVARQQTMAENLRATVADVLAQPTRPSGVFIDGDLAFNTGQVGDYQTFLELIKPLREARVPLHLGLGNHDDRGHFREVLHAEPPADAAIVDRQVAVVNGLGLRTIVLDSLQRPNFTPGLLGERQLEWLAKALDAEAATPTVLFVHHNLSTREGALTDTPALLQVIEPRKQVKAVVYGHSHRWEHEDRNGLHLVNVPAIAYAFADDQPLGWVRFEPTDGGAELALRCIGGDRSKDGQRLALTWRNS